LRNITLDTGPISRFLAEDKLPRLESLFEKIKKREIDGYIVSPVLAEVFKHLCIEKGKSFAEYTLISLLKNYPLQVIPPNVNLSLKAGSLKCRFRKKFSYIDCFVLAFALIHGYEVHTTEKNLPSIQKLKIITYNY